MLTQLDFRTRNFTWNDLPAAVDLINTCQEADGLEGRITLEEAEQMWRAPFLDLENNCFVAVNAENTLIGFSFAIPGAVPYKGQGNGAVHPDYRRRGIGTQLIKLTDDNFLKTASTKVEPEQVIYVHRGAVDKQREEIAMLEANGYSVSRQFYDMRTDLATQTNAPVFPAGFELRPFDRERDAKAVYEAHQESFRDHWGHEGDTPYERWETGMLNHPKSELEMWFIAYDGDQIAGLALCHAWGDDQPGLGWVDILGVRRPWRKRGLAMALLKHSFHAFKQRGFTHVGLGVDSSSKTNAVSLYENAGMQVHLRAFSYRRILRGSANQIHD